MTPQLENAIAIARSLSVPEQRELLDILSNLVDETEEEDIEPSVEEIAASLESALHEVKAGQTKPISQLWDDLKSEPTPKDDKKLLQLLKPGATYEIWSPFTSHEAAWQLAELLEADSLDES
ncbi:MAG: hypothetical protein KME18_02530 [Phormidium tanganyikae FI6-MK23]|jgi:hypothetical protein|nr:hypothetical protein [Phormidium tanganyikae FI6-MK23]